MVRAAVGEKIIMYPRREIITSAKWIKLKTLKAYVSADVKYTDVGYLGV